jgi:hypothetical protein
MAGVITTSSFAKALWPGVNAWYGRKYKDYQTEYDKIFTKNSSKKNYEEDVGTSSLGLASEKTQGGAISYDDERQGFTTRYTHIVYALGFIITREMVEDDQYSIVGQRKAGALARSMRQTKETVAANVLNRATNSSYTGGDGIVLLSASHVNVAGGTYKNKLTTDADLSEAALEQAVIDIAAFTDDRGLLIAAKPKKLIIAPANMFEATRILKSVGRVGSAENDINALKDMGMFSDVCVNHFITDTDAWYILTDVDDGMKYFERRGDQFEMDNDFDTENAKFKATARYSFGWSDPRGIFGSTGA